MIKATLAVLAMLSITLAGCTSQTPAAANEVEPQATVLDFTPPIVATFDTGTNPFHPCWNRDAGNDAPTILAAMDIPATTLELARLESYWSSLDASNDTLLQMESDTLYAVAGTNLMFYDVSDKPWQRFVDGYPEGRNTHGAQASSQIGCPEYGTAPESLVLILDFYDQEPAKLDELILWTANQPWIDVVHTNIQEWYTSNWWTEHYEELQVLADNHFVVMAGGNFYTAGETSGTNSFEGILIAGANDNGGYTSWSYMDPHVVMDGGNTVSADADSFDETTFGGTSSASPRTSGYVAHVLSLLREHYGVSGIIKGGFFALPEGIEAPAEGPLADGLLKHSELHEVIRKTADPNPHDSQFDGGRRSDSITQPAPLPVAFYPKMGYGEVSEHTWDHALAVLIGDEPMPERAEDQFYFASETVRDQLWS